MEFEVGRTEVRVGHIGRRLLANGGLQHGQGLGVFFSAGMEQSERFVDFKDAGVMRAQLRQDSLGTIKIAAILGSHGGLKITLHR